MSTSWKIIVGIAILLAIALVVFMVLSGIRSNPVFLMLGLSSILCLMVVGFVALLKGAPLPDPQARSYS